MRIGHATRIDRAHGNAKNFPSNTATTEIADATRRARPPRMSVDRRATSERMLAMRRCVSGIAGATGRSDVTVETMLNPSEPAAGADAIVGAWTHGW